MGGNKHRVFIGLFFRPTVTRLPESVQLGHARFHWAIWIEAKDSPGTGFSCELLLEDDPYSDVPDAAGWVYSHRHADWRKSEMMMGRILVGKLPNGVGPEHVEALLAKIPLPSPNATSPENSVIWTMQAIKVLQERRWVEEFDIREFIDHGLERATAWLEGKLYPGMNSMENYTSRPM